MASQPTQPNRDDMGQFVSQAQQPVQNDPNPEAAWWCKLLARGVAVVGAVIAAAMGVWTCVSLKPICIGAGIIQILVSFVVLVFEAPVCCQWLEVTQFIARFAENRSWFQKALIYGILAIIPIAMCFGISTLFGAGLIFAAAVLYGLMALGKKGTLRQEQGTADTENLNQPPPGQKMGRNEYDEAQTFAQQQAAGYAQQAAPHIANYAAQNVTPQMAADFGSAAVKSYTANQY